MDHNHMDMGGGDAPDMSAHMAGMKMYVHGGIGEDVLWFASWQPTSAGATVGVCIGVFLLAILDRWIHALWRACQAGWNRGKIFSLPVASGPLPPSSAYTTSTSTSAETATRRNGKQSDDSETPSLSEKTPMAILTPQKQEAEACQCGCGGECGSSSGVPANCRPDRCEPSAPRYEAVDRGLNDDSYLPRAARGLDPERPERWSRPFRWSVDIPRGLLYALLTLIHFLLMLVIMTYQIWWMISVIVGVGVGEALFGRFGASRV